MRCNNSGTQCPFVSLTGNHCHCVPRSCPCTGGCSDSAAVLSGWSEHSHRSIEGSVTIHAIHRFTTATAGSTDNVISSDHSILLIWRRRLPGEEHHLRTVSIIFKHDTLRWSIRSCRKVICTMFNNVQTCTHISKLKKKPTIL